MRIPNANESATTGKAKKDTAWMTPLLPLNVSFYQKILTGY